MKGPIVVPLDGSDFAEVALSLGSLLAELTHSALHLVHVIRPPIASAFHPEEQLSAESAFRRAAFRYVEDVAAVERMRATVPVVCALLTNEHGVAATLSQYATEVSARWIVLTTHGAGGLSRLVLGSVADDLTRTSRTPLMFLRPWDVTAMMAPSERRFRWILIPLDGSREAEAALEPAAELARATRASLSLVQVVPPGQVSTPRAGTSASGGAVASEAALYLEGIVEDLRASRLSAESWVVANSDVAAGVLTAAVERSADLIVMATHGRHGLERVIVGSVGDEVLRKTTLPLALVRPRALGAVLDEDFFSVAANPSAGIVDPR
jgi:nucleotide-binding universal stress UspA family protein